MVTVSEIVSRVRAVARGVVPDAVLVDAVVDGIRAAMYELWPCVPPIAMVCGYGQFAQTFWASARARPLVQGGNIVWFRSVISGWAVEEGTRRHIVYKPLREVLIAEQSGTMTELPDRVLVFMPGGDAEDSEDRVRYAAAVWSQGEWDTVSESVRLYVWGLPAALGLNSSHPVLDQFPTLVQAYVTERAAVYLQDDRLYRTAVRDYERAWLSAKAYMESVAGPKRVMMYEEVTSPEGLWDSVVVDPASRWR